MPRSARAAYAAAYYSTNKAQKRARASARRAEARADPVILARRQWLKNLLALHGLTRQELATLLGIETQTPYHWLLSTNASSWEPMNAEQEGRIRVLLPESAPMSARRLKDALGWNSAQRRAYLKYFGLPIPVSTGAQLRAWRLAHCGTQEALANTLGVTAGTVRGWERTGVIPRRQHRVVAWLLGFFEQEKIPVDIA